MRTRLLDPDAVRALARGCAVLGAGGGGDTYLALLQALQATEDHGPVPLVDLDELPDDSLVMPGGGIGDPAVSIEKIENGNEGARLKEELEFLTGRSVAALMASEIGGGNGVLPIAWAAGLHLPLVDADGMGRAFPEVPQVTMQLAGISPSPAVMTDERGNLIVFRTISGQWMERLERAAAGEFGRDRPIGPRRGGPGRASGSRCARWLATPCGGPSGGSPPRGRARWATTSTSSP